MEAAHIFLTASVTYFTLTYFILLPFLTGGRARNKLVNWVQAFDIGQEPKVKSLQHFWAAGNIMF